MDLEPAHTGSCLISVAISASRLSSYCQRSPCSLTTRSNDKQKKTFCLFMLQNGIEPLHTHLSTPTSPAAGSQLAKKPAILFMTPISSCSPNSPTLSLASSLALSTASPAVSQQNPRSLTQNNKGDPSRRFQSTICRTPPLRDHPPRRQPFRRLAA